MIIVEVWAKNAPQMPLVEDDRMVQAFAPHTADQAFHIRILPRAPWRRDDLFHAHRRHGRAERLPVCAVPVADQVPRRRAPRECLSDLLCDPRHRRVRRDSEMHDLAALVVEHDEPEQEVERGRGDHEEIDRRRAIGVICKECPPRLRWRRWVTDHVFRDGGLGDGKAKLQKLAMDPRCAPTVCSPATSVGPDSGPPSTPAVGPVFPRRDFHVQKSLNPLRCQPMTISGLTITRAWRQPGHRQDRMTQKPYPPSEAMAGGFGAWSRDGVIARSPVG